MAKKHRSRSHGKIAKKVRHLEHSRRQWRQRVGLRYHHHHTKRVDSFLDDGALEEEEGEEDGISERAGIAGGDLGGICG